MRRALLALAALALVGCTEIITPPRLWVALVNYTTAEVFYSTRYDTEAEALTRYRILVTQAELNEAGLGMGPGDWGAYLGAVSFSFGVN